MYRTFQWITSLFGIRKLIEIFKYVLNFIILTNQKLRKTDDHIDWNFYTKKYMLFIYTHTKKGIFYA